MHTNRTEDTQTTAQGEEEERSSLTSHEVDLSSLGDQFCDVTTVQLTLENKTLSHGQCQILGRNLQRLRQLRELKLDGITCTTHGRENGCGDLNLDKPLRLHDITLNTIPFTNVVINTELLLRCHINLRGNIAGQVSTLQSLLAARNLEQFTCLHVHDAAAVNKLVDVLPQLRSLQQLKLWHMDFSSVTDIRLSPTNEQLKSVRLYSCKFEHAGLWNLLQQHNIRQKRVKITLCDVTVKGKDDLISKIRQSSDTDVTDDIGVEYSGGEWSIWRFIFFTKK